MYPFGDGGRNAVCGVIPSASHPDFHHTRFVYQNPSNGFATYPPQVTQFRDSVMAFESCVLTVHPSVSSVALGFLDTIRSMHRIRAIRADGFSIANSVCPTMPDFSNSNSPDGSVATMLIDILRMNSHYRCELSRVQWLWSDETEFADRKWAVHKIPVG